MCTLNTVGNEAKLGSSFVSEKGNSDLIKHLIAPVASAVKEKHRNELFLTHILIYSTKLRQWQEKKTF